MSKFMIGVALAFGLGGTACHAQPSLETEEAKTLYALGVALGSNLGQFDLSAEEMRSVVLGIQDMALGNELKVDMATYGPLLEQFAIERASAGVAAEKQASAAFVAEQARQAGAEQSETGVVYVQLERGSGASPRATDTVVVHYHGTLRDGEVFDSSIDRGQPISFPLNGVIPCWTEGVQKMQIGGKAKLVCPSDTAYGDRGQGPIPGGAALVFEVELLDIETE